MRIKGDGCFLPGYVRDWAITDLIFCSILSFVFPVLCLMAAASGVVWKNEFIIVAIFALIGGLGVWANIAILRLNPLGVKLACVNIVLTCLSIVVNVMHNIMDNESGLGGLSRDLKVLQDSCGEFARVILLFFYTLAILKARAFFRNGNEADQETRQQLS